MCMKELKKRRVCSCQCIPLDRKSSPYRHMTLSSIFRPSFIGDIHSEMEMELQEKLRLVECQEDQEASGDFHLADLESYIINPRDSVEPAARSCNKEKEIPPSYHMPLVSESSTKKQSLLSQGCYLLMDSIHVLGWILLQRLASQNPHHDFSISKMNPIATMKKDIELGLKSMAFSGNLLHWNASIAHTLICLCDIVQKQKPSHQSNAETSLIQEKVAEWGIKEFQCKEFSGDTNSCMNLFYHVGYGIAVAVVKGGWTENGALNNNIYCEWWLEIQQLASNMFRKEIIPKLYITGYCKGGTLAVLLHSHFIQMKQQNSHPLRIQLVATYTFGSSPQTPFYQNDHQSSPCFQIFNYGDIMAMASFKSHSHIGIPQVPLSAVFQKVETLGGKWREYSTSITYIFGCILTLVHVFGFLIWSFLLGRFRSKILAMLLFPVTFLWLFPFVAVALPTLCHSSYAYIYFINRRIQ